MTIQHILQGLQPSDLAPQVLLGFCDLDGASLKALAALHGTPGSTTCSMRSLDLRGAGTASAADPPTQRTPAFSNDLSTPATCHGTASLLNIHRLGELTPQVSIISINAALPEDEQAYVAADLMNLIATSQQQQQQQQQQQHQQPATQSNPKAVSGCASPCLYVLASTLIPQTKQAGVVHVLNTGSAQRQPLAQHLSARGCPLPPAAQLHDNMLALLHHTAVATGTAASFLLAPGYRPPAGSSADNDSLEGAGRLVSALLEAFSSEAGAAAGVDGVLAADLSRATQHLTLQHNWFSGSRSSAAEGVMYC